MEKICSCPPHCPMWFSREAKEGDGWHVRDGKLAHKNQGYLAYQMLSGNQDCQKELENSCMEVCQTCTKMTKTVASLHDEKGVKKYLGTKV